MQARNSTAIGSRRERQSAGRDRTAILQNGKEQNGNRQSALLEPIGQHLDLDPLDDSGADLDALEFD